MNRRRLLLAAATGLAFAPLAAKPQGGRVPHIGFLTMRSESNEYDVAFREGLRALGYGDDRIKVEYRWAAGSEQRAREFAAELVSLKMDIIVVATTPAIRAVMAATRTIPIVMAASSDPEGTGLVASLASPGGNVTGLSMGSLETAAKRLQFLRDFVPGVTRVAVLAQNFNAATGGNQAAAMFIGALQPAARQMGLTLTITNVAGQADIAGAIAAWQKERAQALVVQASPLTIDNRVAIVQAAARLKLPAMYELEGFVDAGGLLSYGPSLIEMNRRAATFVDAILKGAKPAQMPVELPTHYDLVINLKAAKALGLEIPLAMVLRASRLVE